MATVTIFDVHDPNPFATGNPMLHLISDEMREAKGKLTSVEMIISRAYRKYESGVHVKRDWTGLLDDLFIQLSEYVNLFAYDDYETRFGYDD